MILKSAIYANIICCILLFSQTISWASSPLEALKTIPSSSLLVVDEQNQTLHADNIDRLFIPASTVKILTALIALEHWGKDHRFTTEFYLEPSTNYLWVKGFGDPYLISEELDLVVAQIKQAGITELDGIGVDTRYFEKDIVIDGQGESLNPYDASVGAVAANFNTIKIHVYADSISSGEIQTPMTSIAEDLSIGLSEGIHRINIRNAEIGTKYFAELIKSKLNRSGVLTDSSFSNDPIPKNAKLFISHQNSFTLEQVIATMLEYSNNFIANQLYLLLGADAFGEPANMKKAQLVAKNYIDKYFNWTDYVLYEGAGLSRLNQLSSKQLIDILDRFKPYRELLPKQSTQISAKSGTLEDVSTYAGYLKHKNEWRLFALMINQKVPYNFREQIAVELLK